MTLQTPFGFADEMRVGLRGLGTSGREGAATLQLVYEWLYLFVVVDGQKGKLYWSWIDSMRGDMTAAAVNGLRQQTEIAAVVWDGAAGHRGELVRGMGLPLIGLPPYSPELNPAERVFQEVRRWIEGRVYRSIEDKVEEVDAVLAN